MTVTTYIPISIRSSAMFTNSTTEKWLNKKIIKWKQQPLKIMYQKHPIKIHNYQAPTMWQATVLGTEEKWCNGVNICVSLPLTTKSEALILSMAIFGDGVSNEVNYG